MQDTKPYKAPDFQTEKASGERKESRMEYLARTAQEQLRKMRHDHEQKIRQLKRAHQQELENTSADSCEKGRQQGLQEGYESVQKALTALEKMAQKLVASEKAFLLNAEKHAVTLAVAVAKRILGREVQSDRQIVVHIIREALKQVADKTRIVIKVNPLELDNVLAHRKELQTMDKHFPELEFIPDDKISPGACLIETRTGSIDGRLESQLEEIERNFLASLGKK